MDPFDDEFQDDKVVRPSESSPVVVFIVRNAILIFGTILLACVGITSVLYVMVLKNTGNPFSDLGMEMDVKDIISIHYNSLRLARREVIAARTSVAEAVDTTPIQSEVAESTYWAFESDSKDGVFGDPLSIGRMKDTFDIFLQDAGFEEYCLMDSNQECERPLSPLRMYYASSWDSVTVQSVIDDLQNPENVEKFNSLGWCYVLGINCEDAPQNVPRRDRNWVNNVYDKVVSIMDSWDMRGELIDNYKQATELASYLLQTEIFKPAVDFGYDKDFSSENQVSKYSRGILQWGSPLGIPSNETVKTQLKDLIKDKYLKQMDNATEDQSYYFMSNLIDDAVLGIIIQDSLFSIVSLTLIFLLIRFSTGSWFLAIVGFSEIFFSITISWFLFKVAFQIEYFPPQNALAFFIVAAIGADDIFIFMDAYKESSQHLERLYDLETRMAWVYKKTGLSMFITSATTCIAFFFSFFVSPLPSVKSFGLFTATVVFFDYVLVMTLFCTAVVIYHDRYEAKSPFGCCFPCSKINPSNSEIARDALVKGDPSNETSRRGWIASFFTEKVPRFITNKFYAAIILISVALWMGFIIRIAVKIDTAQQAEQFLNKNHPIQKSFTILNTAFSAANDDARLKIYYAWGVDEVDQDGVNLLTDPQYYGEAQFVDSFDFNELCQTQLVSFCHALRTDPKYEDLIKRNKGVGEVHCFMEELAAYSVLGNLNDCDYVLSGMWRNEDWQINPEDLPQIMEGFLDQTSCFSESGHATSIESMYESELGWNGTSMQYAAISARTKVLTPFGIFPKSVTRHEYDQFVVIAEELGKTVSEYCYGNVMLTDLDRKFVFMNNQSIYAKTAVQNSYFGVAIAFLILLLKTGVFHIALFASLTIGCVLVSVVGVMVMLGWELGTMESILVGILSGFSVDYIVHLAQEYKSCKGDTKKRAIETLEILGVSLFYGMITSVAASIPLMAFCQLQFFVKFGVFFMSTIIFSWMFANLLFMTLLALSSIPVKRSGWKKLTSLSLLTFTGFSIGVKLLYSWARQL